VIHTRIQHHPSRAYLLPELLERLDAEAEVVTDPEPDAQMPSPWRTYRACLELPPAGATHLLVLQDDVLPCRNLVAACEQIAAPWPVCLFLGGAPVRTAREAARTLRRGGRYVDVHRGEWVPVIAVLWPVEAAARLLEWCDRDDVKLPGHPNPRSDDAVVGKWAKLNRERVTATVPSLVQHPDIEPSLIGKRARAGRTAWRVAAHWIGEEDPLDMQWGLTSPAEAL
jgi:hypothetical protein